MLEKINDLEPFKKYKDIEFRKLSDREISWKPFNPIRILGGDYLIRMLKNDNRDFKKSAKLWRKSFAELYGGPYDFLLCPDEYVNIFGKGNKFLEGEWFLFVIEYENDLVGASLLHMNAKNMAIEWSLAAIDPSHRNKNLFRPIVEICDEITKNSGAEYACMYAATFHKISQNIAIEIGFTIRGVIPGFILAWNGDDMYYRHPIVFMDKFYNDGEKLSTRDMALSSQAKEVWDLIQRFEKSKG
jgi:hypothetical protein